MELWQLYLISLVKFLARNMIRNIKNISPLIEEINNEFQNLNNISNDQLRKKPYNLKNIYIAHIERKKIK